MREPLTRCHFYSFYPPSVTPSPVWLWVVRQKIFVFYPRTSPTTNSNENFAIFCLLQKNCSKCQHCHFEYWAAMSTIKMPTQTSKIPLPKTSSSSSKVESGELTISSPPAGSKIPVIKSLKSPHDVKWVSMKIWFLFSITVWSQEARSSFQIFNFMNWNVRVES